MRHFLLEFVVVPLCVSSFWFILRNDSFSRRLNGLMVMDSQFEIHLYIHALQMTVITDDNIHLQSSTNSHK